MCYVGRWGTGPSSTVSSVSAGSEDPSVSRSDAPVSARLRHTPTPREPPARSAVWRCTSHATGRNTVSSSQLGVQWAPPADGDLLPGGRRGGEAGGAPVSLPRRFVLGHPVGWDSVAGASQPRSPSKQHLRGGVRIKKKRRERRGGSQECCSPEFVLHGTFTPYRVRKKQNTSK